MKTLKSFADVEVACLPPSLNSLVKRLYGQLQSAHTNAGFRYSPEDDGFIVLVEEHDHEDEISSRYGYKLLDAVYESVRVEAGCFIADMLHNNQFGITWIIPDAPWLDKRLRERLASECVSQEAFS